ncbi:MAG: hypothetical protein ACYCT9_04770 [Leptospirillum sp.]|jgi:hypothetical protein
MDVEKVFANITGRKMTPDEVTRYLKFQKEFEIPDTDPTWMMFIWFEFYQRIFEQFPASARAEAEVITRQVKEASIKVTEATAAEVKAAREKAVIEINELQETVKKNVSDALGPTLTTKIGKAVNTLKSQSNRPLHKKWLIAMGVAIVVALGLGGYGFWDFSEYEQNVGEAKMSAVLDEGGDFSHFMKCDEPGWKKQWTNNTDGKKVLACYPYQDSKGKTSGWTITP